MQRLFLSSILMTMCNEGTILYGKHLLQAEVSHCHHAWEEQVIAPLLQESMSVEIVTAAGLNTDQFGTFTGKIEWDVD